VRSWDDYWQQLADMIDIAYDEFGLRTQLTIFADAQLMPTKSDRLAHLRRVLDALKGREHKVILLEVANEAWQNGFPGAAGEAQLREFGRYLADRTDTLVALSATQGQDNESLARLYVRSAADIATEHFSRDLRTPEGGWLPVRDAYRVNSIDRLPPASSNEPIGPGASVASQEEPIKLVSAAAYAWMSGLPLYVYHSRAGVFGDARFEDMPGVDAYRDLRAIIPADVANWRRTEGKDEFAPFVTFAGGQRDKWRTEVPDAATGVVRHLSCVNGHEFCTLPIGIARGGVELEARRHMTLRVFDPLTGKLVREATLKAAERITLPQGPQAYVIRGRFLD
jgi:hypothetical protein